MPQSRSRKQSRWCPQPPYFHFDQDGHDGFEKIKDEYELCPDFCDIYAILIDGSTQEVDGYTLHDGYLFLG